MRTFITLFLALFIAHQAGAQNKGNASTAGRYAKDFANRMYNTDPTYGDKHRGLNVNIKDWKTQTDDQGTTWYFVKMELTWQEGTGYLDWKDVRYNGCMVADEFGCNPLYFVQEKKEPNILGLLKRVQSLNEEDQATAASKDEWMTGVKYVWGVEGCLNDN